jgi:hypothetical protein
MQTHASAHGLHGFGEECGKNFYVMWAVICSTVSAFVSLYLLLAGLVNGGANPIPLLGMSMKWPSGFLAIWWTFGTGTFTFDKPFAHVGNGFFASWLAFSASLVLAASHIPIVAQKFNDARTAVQAQYIALMCFVSGINLVASSVACSNLCGALGGWAVACSAVSFLVSGACILTPGAPGSLGPVSSKHVAIFFAVWWSVGVFFQTFEEPFVSVTTGYLSAWLSFAVALRLNGFTPPPLVNENQ